MTSLPACVTDALLHLILVVICRSTNRSFVNERAHSVIAPKTNLLCFWNMNPHDQNP
jgi:hypothetical protein